MLTTRGSPLHTLLLKYQTQKLYERGLPNKDVVKIFNIIDTMMTLTQELQAEFVNIVKRFEEERTMSLISPTILLAKEEGRKERENEMLRVTVPLLLKTGMSIEEISQQLNVSVDTVRTAVQ